MVYLFGACSLGTYFLNPKNLLTFSLSGTFNFWISFLVSRTCFRIFSTSSWRNCPSPIFAVLSSANNLFWRSSSVYSNVLPASVSGMSLRNSSNSSWMRTKSTLSFFRMRLMISQTEEGSVSTRIMTDPRSSISFQCLSLSSCSRCWPLSGLTSSHFVVPRTTFLRASSPQSFLNISRFLRIVPNMRVWVISWR